MTEKTAKKAPARATAEDVQAKAGAAATDNVTVKSLCATRNRGGLRNLLMTTLRDSRLTNEDLAEAVVVLHKALAEKQ